MDSQCNEHQAWIRYAGEKDSDVFVQFHLRHPEAERYERETEVRMLRCYGRTIDRSKHTASEYMKINTLTAALWIQHEMWLEANHHNAPSIAHLIKFLGHWHYEDELAKANHALEQANKAARDAHEKQREAQEKREKYGQGLTPEDLIEDIVPEVAGVLGVLEMKHALEEEITRTSIK